MYAKTESNIKIKEGEVKRMVVQGVWAFWCPKCGNWSDSPPNPTAPSAACDYANASSNTHHKGGGEVLMVDGVSRGQVPWKLQPVWRGANTPQTQEVET